MRKSFVWSAMLLAFVVCACGAQAGLLEYVQSPDPSFKWEKISQNDTFLGSLVTLDMTSQTWQGITWTHKIEIYKPAKCDYPKTAMLVVTGGNPGGNNPNTALGITLAARAGCPIAILYGIPNQPLFGGRNEDALIAYTFAKALETGDYDWGLLLPMTKSAVRAMDAVQGLSKSWDGGEITGFVVTGASKRGWTTWLTAAADPGRVKGIIPIVYDNLNLPAQMKYQLECYGKYSSQIDDYTKLGIQDTLQTEAGLKLSGIVDPWAYRERITMPKLILNGANDPYWVVDSLNLYWDDLKGDKAVFYMPNGGHDMGLTRDPVGNLQKATAPMAAFTRAVAAGKNLPGMTWKHSTDKDAHRLRIKVDPSGNTARLWVAQSDTHDFRNSEWKPVDMQAEKDGFAGEVALPSAGYMAVFGEVTFAQNPLEYSLCTQVSVVKR